MRKSVALFLAILCILSCVFVGCSKPSDDSKNGTTDGGLNSSNNDYIMGTEDVTDKNGETVTDKNGEAVTTAVYYRKEKENGKKKVYVKQNEKGEDITDSNGKKVTTEIYKKETTTKSNSTELPSRPASTKPDKTTETTTKKGESVETTDKELTTLALKDDVVPSTSQTGKAVKFSAEDQQIIKSMLEVPYLYCASYENKDGIPTNLAAHVAMWMAEREELNTTEYASGTIVLDLFKYFAQTVVNFKTDCNSGKDPQSSITYNTVNDSFKITAFENPTHTVTITRIEKLGNNNYYKIYADVSGADGISKVVSVIQKNQIDSSLGFSVKALKWS